MKSESKKFDVSFFLHLIFSVVIIVFFYEAGERYKPKSTDLCAIFNGFAVFETAMLFLHVFDNVVIVASHLLYQSICFIYPCFLFYFTVSYNININATSEILDDFHLTHFKEALSQNVTSFWFVLFFAVWTGRILLHRKIVVKKVADFFIRNKTKVIEVIKETGEMTRLLNATAVILFTVLAYVNGGTFQNILIGLAIFEVIMSLAYVCPISFLINLHTLYQAAAFSVPLFLLTVVIINEEYAHETKQFLLSYGLFKVNGFVSQRPWFGSLSLLSFWFFRLLHTVLAIVETDAQQKVLKKKKSNKKNLSLVNFV